LAHGAIVEGFEALFVGVVARGDLALAALVFARAAAATESAVGGVDGDTADAPLLLVDGFDGVLEGGHCNDFWV
jgi:hypothetical protein